jgi:F-type H+-transporting ATPase subunit b
MENFDKIELFPGIGLNLDILETGVLNILALLAILFYTGRDLLGSILEERRTVIVKGIENAEERLVESQSRLNEAKKQLEQVNIVIGEIKNETSITKKILLESDANQARKDLKIRFERAFASFKSTAKPAIPILSPALLVWTNTMANFA